MVNMFHNSSEKYYIKYQWFETKFDKLINNVIIL